ncbi:hypothetical protein ZIOFF_049390 [Zingiber officinale]|uniref:GDSL esterase/lipase 7 n=1 Tax=Zingiber officinale TaxID=94328 RepID=A0A8J5G947_ZINOF|nr:hypothetical protein ZIOFF_049390 [Zingiber officinale]
MEKRLNLFMAVLQGLLFCTTTRCATVPAMFIFGDSLIDSGNNNYIASVARANYYPYGIDFIGPTGRFCNGLTVTDYAGFGEAKYLGLPFPPPYLSVPSGAAMIMGGVNYGSAAAGILDETGNNYGSKISLNEQIELFGKTVEIQLTTLLLDPEALSDYLSSSLFIVTIGSNDYINNYLLPEFYSTSRIYSGEDFAKLLVDNLSQQLMRMYNIGARKMLLVGIGPLGCIPNQLAMNPNATGCVEAVNDLVRPFNQNLKQAMLKLNSTLPGSFFVFHNIYDTFIDMVQNSSKYGFLVTNQACCGHGRYGGQLSCLPMERPCSNRDQYLFWDSFHPTQAANAIMSNGCFSATATDCFPITGDQLVEI